MTRQTGRDIPVRFVRHLGRFVVATLLVATLIAFGQPGQASAADPSWSIVETKGSVQVLRAGFQPVALTDGIALHPGDRIVTSGDGRAVLTSGKDTIIVAPNSEIGLPALKRPGWGTRIIQEIGTTFFKVESAKERRFEVETPVLAAVVKGTRFTVSANPVGAAVHVLEGAVEVSAFDSQQTGLVMPGQTARLDSSPGSRLEIDGNDAPAGNKTERFERSIQTEETEQDETPAIGSPEIEQADASRGPQPNGAGPAIVTPEIKAAVLDAVSEEAQPDAAQRPAARGASDSPGPKVIRVSLGNTDINLRQVTRGLVRSVVPDNAAAQSGKAKQDTPDSKVGSAVNAKAKAVLSQQAADRPDGAAGELSKRFVANGGIKGLARAALVANGLPIQESTGGLPLDIDEDRGTSTGLGSQTDLTTTAGLNDLGDDRAAPLDLDDGNAAPTGLGQSALPDKSDLPDGLGGDTGLGGDAGGAGGVATGLGDLPSGLKGIAGLPDGLGDSGSPGDDVGDIGEALDNIREDLDDLDDIGDDD